MLNTQYGQPPQRPMMRLPGPPRRKINPAPQPKARKIKGMQCPRCGCVMKEG